MDLQNARVLVTGGASGIGNYIALELAPRVQVVHVLDVRPMPTDEVRSNVKWTECDVTNPDQVEKAVEAIFLHGGVNVVVNCAGIIHNEMLVSLISKQERRHSIQSWQKVIDVNLNAVMYVTSNVVERMILNRVRGVIVNISSITAQGNLGQSAYAATKAAVEALTKTWSKELAMFKIRSVCIAPGFFNTPSTRGSLSEAMLSKWEKSIPLMRLGELHEILHALEFLIGNEYYNGKVLSLDGGLTI